MSFKFRDPFPKEEPKTYEDWLKTVSDKSYDDKFNRPDWYSGFTKGRNWYDFSNLELENVLVQKAFGEALTLRGATFRDVVFEEGDFSRADFRDCYFINTRFNKTILTNSNFEGAVFENCNLNRVNLANANFCVKKIEETVVYGISAWDLQTSESSIQSKLVIERTYGFYSEIIAEGRIPMMVDDIELAQFIYYLTNHKKLRETINVMNTRSVLLLGRFKDGGLERLYEIREWLLAKNYLPMIFDFERPDSLDLVEVIVTMGGLSKFIIADLSGPFVNTELNSIASLYLKPIIVFHTDDPKRAQFEFEQKNKYLHSVSFDGSSKDLMDQLGVKVEEIDSQYQQFITETTLRSDQKYLEGRENS